jgi:polyisoprenyl-teichoic acid--peptidoglycan teichoic acid transferase
VSTSIQTSHQPKGQRFVTFLLALILPLFVCGGMAAGYYFFDTIRQYIALANFPDYGSVSPSGSQQSAPAPSSLPNIAAGDRVNVLLLGIDKREGEVGPFRTDTMILATLDPKTKTGGMLSIPRDLYVPIPMPGIGLNRINTANFFGDMYKYPGGGPALAKKAVEYNLGVAVHFYVLIDFNGFRKIVDTLGGIDVDVPAPIDDKEYPTENYGIKSIHIPAGHLHMDGELALEYARSRHTTSDFDRSRRQMQIIMAIRDKALKIDALSKLPLLIMQLRDSIETDLTPQEIIALAPIAAQVRADNLKSLSIDQTMTYEITLNNGADVLWPERSKIAGVVKEMFPPQAGLSQADALKKENARIAVLNGTLNSGYAEQTADYLKAHGFNVVQTDNARRSDYKQTVILDSAGKPGTLAALLQALSMQAASVQPLPSSVNNVDIEVILGADWTLPAQ